jgi:hypothetical protein
MSPNRTKIARLMCELWFCINVAWMFVWSIRISSHSELPLASDLGRWWSRTISPMPEPRTVLGQIVGSFVLGLLGLILMRMLGRFPIYIAFLRAVPGVVAIVGFPLFALNFRDAYFIGPIHFYRFGDLGQYCIGLEILLALVCGAVHYLGKWKIPSPLGVLLLALHFALWAWLTESYMMWRGGGAFIHDFGFLSLIAWSFFDCGFPVIGFMAVLTWGIYVTLSRSPEGLVPRQD